MKFYLSQIDDLLDKIEKKTIKGLLLYGPDKGYISKVCKLIINKLNLTQTTINYKDISPSNLRLILNTTNFFGQREFVKILDATPSVSKDLQNVLSTDFSHFIAFIADEMPVNSSLRKMFEKSPYLAALACYYDNEQNVTRIIAKKCAKYAKTLEKEALEYLLLHLQGDHKLINNELDKLFSFTDQKVQITLSDVKSVINQNIISNSDELCIYFAKNNVALFLTEIEKLLLQGVNMVLVIRALIRFYINLYIIALKLQSGVDIQSAIKSLSPPIFFKYVSDFTSIAMGLKLPEILATLSYLQNAEVEYKLQPENFDLYQQVFAVKFNNPKDITNQNSGLDNF